VDKLLLQSSAKVYWNKETEVVYIDAAGLPEPPKGMVYQVWALKLNPLTPTSIGLLDNFDKNNSRIFAVSNTGDEALGTLEQQAEVYRYNGTIVHLRKSIKTIYYQKTFNRKSFVSIVIDFIDYICIIKIFMSYTLLSSPLQGLPDLEMRKTKSWRN
jgi:hypothetical protein